MKSLDFVKKQVEEVKTDIVFSTSYKTIIILDGHGLSTTQSIELTNSCYYLSAENTTLNSINFNEFLERLCVTAGSVKNELMGIKSTQDHILFPLKGSQKFNGYTIQKVIKAHNITDYKVSSIINNFEIGEKQCALKFIYTNFHPTSKNRLVQIRIEGTDDKNIKLSEIEEFVTPWFQEKTNDSVIENLIWESCGQTSDLSEPSSIEYVWGACREYE